MSEKGEQAPSTEEIDSLKAKLESYENLLKDVKNERGEQKYLNVETAIKALGDSQEYISKLKSESTESIEKLLKEVETYQEQLSERDSLSSLMERLQGVVKAPKEEIENKKGNDLENNEQEFSLEQIDSLVEKKLQEIKTKESAQKNLEDSLNMVKSYRGDVDLEKFLEDKAEEVGLTKESLSNLASSSPEAFKRLVGISGRANSSTGFPVGSGGRIPPANPDDLPDPTPTTSMLRGATDAQRQDYMKVLTERAMKRLGVS